MEEQKINKKLNASTKSFIVAIAILLVLMIIALIMACTIPAGQYARNADGEIIVGEYTQSGVKGIPFWKWILSPFLVLGADGNLTIIGIIVFLLVIGGIFKCLDQCGFMKYMLNKITYKFGSKRYVLLAIVMFFFMAMGSCIGTFEECVPLIPIGVALAISLGFDNITGIAMILLSAGCGFAAGVFNPFSTGVAQKLAGLSMFSGVWLRLVSFVLIYALLFLFVFLHCKKIEKPIQMQNIEFTRDHQKDLALWWFVGIMVVGFACVLASAFITVLQDYTLYIVAGTFLISGITAIAIMKFGFKTSFKTFGKGVLEILPAVLMILMASSIKYILTESQVLDTMLHSFYMASNGLPKAVLILFIYLIVIVFNFFIPSASAKAFLIIPLITPLAGMVGLSKQLCIMAYTFGDGFSNVIFPTNPALLLSLGVGDVSYAKWAKWSWKFQLANLVLTCGILLFGLAVGY